ncbi:NAD(P)H-hydrate epimerase [Candidatus Woesearchaeota archaeon]|nr:NAD(P)H-hydrate epimerase [Candidatus Woesearchaeota archaeon]
MVITIDEMKELEFLAVDRGISINQLMENAGKQVFRAIRKKADLKSKHIVVFAGHGNNGGDGFVAARYFAQECPVIVLFFGAEEKMGTETLRNYTKINKQITVIKVNAEEDLQQFRFQKGAELILIDALLGTGVKGPPNENIKRGIGYFNSLDGFKVAVDVPTGIHPDTGEVSETACTVDLIVALHDLKKGLEALQEKSVIVDIGMPKREENEMTDQLPDESLTDQRKP